MPRSQAPPEAPPEANGTPEAPPVASTPARVNPGLMPNAFKVVGKDKPKNARVAGPAVGRSLSEPTIAALRFLRAHAGEWIAVGEWHKPGAPAARLSWAGFFKNDDGSPREPTADEEKATNPNLYPIKKKIDYTFGRDEAEGPYTLYLKLTDTDWTPPVRRGPRGGTPDASTVNATDEPANPGDEGDNEADPEEGA